MMATTGESDDILDAEPVENSPATIQCWSCQNQFGVPPGTPNGSILACPICQNHNRLGGGPIPGSPVMATPVSSTTVIAMPLSSVAIANGGRVQQLISQMKCCWIATIVLATLICVGGFIFGSVCPGDATYTTYTVAGDSCATALYPVYAFPITAGGVLAIIAGWGLWELRTAQIAALRTGETPKPRYFQLTCHLAWLIATAMFIYSCIYLGVFSWIVFLLPGWFSPCICGLAIGPVVWVNCCCYQKDYKFYMLQVNLPMQGGGVPLQQIRTQM